MSPRAKDDPKADASVLVVETVHELAAVGSLLVHHPGEVDVRRIVDDQRTSFSTDDVLRLVEAERRRCAERAQQATVVCSEQAVGVVFDKVYAVTVSGAGRGRLDHPRGEP